MLCTPILVKEKVHDPGPLMVILPTRFQGYASELKDLEMCF